jgi:hypothetical protein
MSAYWNVVSGYRYTAYILFFLIVTLTSESVAQSETVPADSVKIGFLPALGYSSDTGFVAGGLVSRYHYREGVVPFQSHLQSAAIATTKGLFSLMVMYDQVETFGRPIRSKSLLNIGRVKEATYFGFGNESAFEKEVWDDDHYFYETYNGIMELSARKAIWKHPKYDKSHLDVMTLTGIQFNRPQLGNGDSYLETDNPDHIDGGWSWEIGVGLIWENRDSEFAATRGNAGFINFRYAPGLIADFSMWQLHLQASQYATAKIIFPVTAAVKVGYHQAGGSTPFWMLPIAGGEYSMRGYAEGRFRGDASLYYTAELRTWLLQYPSSGFRLGGQLFRDGGRVFESGEIVSSFFQNHHQTYGLGAVLSLFTYDFIIRADIAFSEDISRIYFGIGYTF